MKNNIIIDDRIIGGGYPCLIIAEIGLNHNGSFKIAKELVDVAHEAGADAVKFQKRNLQSLYKKDILENNLLGEQSLQYILPILEEFELSDEVFVKLRSYCREKNIMFLCSAWDIESVDFIENLGVPAYKVASADLTNFEILEYILSKKKPMIVSTGMSTIEEITRTVSFLKERKAEFALLHCNSTYPAAFEDINLRFIKTLKEKFGVPVGYSGHERGIAVSEAAFAMGACIIERHFTLDRTMRGPDHAASLEPQGLKKLIRDIRNIETAMGTGQRWLTRGEVVNRETLGKSLVATRDIKKGEIIRREDIRAKSPGKGISPQRMFELIDRKAIRDIKADTDFIEADFGVSYSGWPRINISKRWGLICRFGDVRDIVMGKPHIIEFHLSDGDLKAEFSQSATYDQELVIHAPEYWKDDLVDLCSGDKRIRELSIATIRKSIDIAKKIVPYFRGTPNNIPKVIVHPGGMHQDEELTNKSQLYSNLEKSLAKINQDGVELLLENMPPLPWYFGGQWYHSVFLDHFEIRDFLEKTNYGLCYDISHAKLCCNYAHYDMVEYTSTLRPYIRHLHIADAGGTSGEGLQIGEGEVNFKPVLKILSDLDVGFVPEIWLGHKFCGEGFWIALQRLEDILADIIS